MTTAFRVSRNIYLMAEIIGRLYKGEVKVTGDL